jgi:hypothetical protein
VSRRVLLRWLAALHRALGCAFCLLFALWFASGIVMTCSGFPRFDERERLAAARPLPASEHVVVSAAPDDGWARARLGMLGGRPVWRLTGHDGALVTLDGERGSPHTCGADDAIALAAAAARAPGHTGVARVERQHDREQFTTARPASGAFPLHRVDLADPQTTVVYVSEPGCEVVQASTGRERVLAWLGAIPHWFYPTVLRRHAAKWRLVVIWVAALGALTCLAGLVLGIVRTWRHKRATAARIPLSSLSPYRKPWLRWHHLLGLGAGTLTFTWVFSGMLSLEPLRWTGDAGDAELAAYRGGAHAPASQHLPVATALAACQAKLAVRELELIRIGDAAYYLCRASWNESRLVRADRGDDVDRADPEVLETVPEAALVAALGQARGGQTPARVALVHEYDRYYYATHASPLRPLPYLQVVWSDATVHYLDPKTGAVLLRSTPRGRAERWLYQGLHSLDMPWLYRRPWLWRIVIVTFSLAGLALAITGVVLSWRYVSRLQRRRRRADQT